MKYAIVSDLHANLEALERVLADAARFGVDQVVCLGDIVGYGPLPAETLRHIRTAASTVLAGNHDDAVSGRIDTKNFIALAGDAVSRHRAELSHDDIAWLRRLPHTATIDGAVLSHGDLTEPEAFRYIDSKETAAANFAATDAPLVFVGHTHVPGFHLTGRSGRVYDMGAEDFAMEPGKRYIVNVGSVGYPRESGGKCFSSYVLYDSHEGSVRFRKLPFAVSSVLQRGHARRRRARLVGLLGALAAFLTVAVLFLREDASGEPKGEAPLPTVERTLELDGTKRAVRANMKLDRKSPAAVLKISFFDTAGVERTSCVYTGKSSLKKFAVPTGAVKAVFSITPAIEGQEPIVKDFTPEAE